MSNIVIRGRVYNMVDLGHNMVELSLPGKDFKAKYSQSQIARWVGGESIQNAMPNNTADEREFLMTGLTPKEWGAMFGTEEYCE